MARGPVPVPSIKFKSLTNQNQRRIVPSCLGRPDRRRGGPKGAIHAPRGESIITIVEELQPRARQLTPSAPLEARRDDRFPQPSWPCLSPPDADFRDTRPDVVAARRCSRLRLVRWIAQPVHARGLRRLAHQRRHRRPVTVLCQRGPTSPGRTWLLDVTNVSVTPYTYSEEFTGNEAVLSRDNLKIAFGVHTV